ncbi:hypothetical protein ACLQ2R_03320 [Streptosporangium sp. DT93]|uniref:hypothetical protein n=1 Tax=Streptosporangium sp. DT93 TaxID=3393428 RepID=UPI003CEEC588
MSADDAPKIFWDWIRLIRRIELGFNPSPTGDPKKRISTTTVQHVAMTAATYANPDGTRIRPGIPRLARVCRLDTTVVGNCLRRLRDLGLLLRVFAGSGAGRNARADEYRMAIPEGLHERVAMLDPDEGELVVPEGVEAPPARKPRAKNKPAEAAGSPGAAPADQPVDNPSSPGAAPADPGLSEKEHPVLHPGTPGAAPSITRCSTAPPTHDLPMTPHYTLSSPYGAEVEVAPARREEPPAADVTQPSANPATSPARALAALDQTDLDAAYAVAFAALNRLPDFGHDLIAAARIELGADAPRAHLVIHAHHLSIFEHPSACIA